MEFDELLFTEQEIQDELYRLGFGDIPIEQLGRFKQDLDALVLADKSQQSLSTVREESYQQDISSIAAADQENLRTPRSPKKSVGAPRKTRTLAAKTTPAATRLRSAAVDGQTRALADDIQEMEDRLNELRIVARGCRPPLRPRTSQHPPSSARSSASDSSLGSGVSNYRSGVILAPRRLPRQPKTDPVARYQFFKRSWDRQKAPGEKSHADLRWDIREQMLTQDEPYQRSRSLPSHNTALPPTEDKRKLLRWEIRQMMAGGR